MNQRRGPNRQARQPRAAMHFKLQLISEVKKHPIIWHNPRGRKDQNLLAEAWNQVRTALHTEDVEYCKQQWRYLLSNYKSHLRYRTAINITIARSMAFTRTNPNNNNAPAGVNHADPPIQLIEVNQAEPNQAEQGPSSHTRSNANEHRTRSTNNFDQAGPSGLTRSRASVEEQNNGDMAHDEAVAQEVVKLLFRTVPGRDKARLRDRLVQVLTVLKPDFKERVMTRAWEELDVGRHFDRIDWSGLEIPVEVCKAIWHFELRNLMCTDNPNRRTSDGRQ